ncbi:UDP-N-acetylmuramate--L-alanine ligase [Luteibaculum oceani]|uniref:Peptidoglycan synthetase n=1 Tax=Luteibaculum oceani TaxID=1294296 RepID=A0A5C6V8I9_9FLAO|nr:Mur ligase family protein [Luteibaculum oceani]TXC81327.1 peptidoglycan synthetase [Luteibaculum oceani]
MRAFNRVHIIAIGGAVMHNMAIALKNKGIKVSGSDDAIFDPSKSRLADHNLLPEKMGWNADRITENIDAVILGMHARPDNPELAKANGLQLPIYSFPEFMFQQSRLCKRLIVAGSHGKTSITGMLLHAYKKLNKPFNYLVGSKLEGFDCMVGFDSKADVAIFEGDEYLSSPLDNRSKFLHYKPHAAIITGLAWDHINVFPTYQSYLATFERLIRDIEPGGALIYFEGDMELKKLVEKRLNPNIRYIPYGPSLAKSSSRGVTLVNKSFKNLELPFFGNHNLANAEGARLLLNEIEILGSYFYNALHDFKGAARRLQLIYQDEDKNIYYDFAHAPSKVKATVKAVRDNFKDRKFIAALELHTFSSLDKRFLPQYKGAMDDVDAGVVFFDPKVLEHKKLPPISIADVKKAFGNQDLLVTNDKSEVMTFLDKADTERNSVQLLMSSGNLFHDRVEAIRF